MQVHSFMRRWIETGWQDDFHLENNWRKEPWLVLHPDDGATAGFGEHGGEFRLTTPQSGMAWTRVINPIWIEDFPRLEMNYERLDGARDGKVLLVLSDDSTGPVTPGALNPENPLASGSQVTIELLRSMNGVFAVDVREHFKSDRIARISLVLEGGESPLQLRIRSMAFLSAQDETGELPPLIPDWRRPDEEQCANGWNQVALPSGEWLSVKDVAKALEASPEYEIAQSISLETIPFSLGDTLRFAQATPYSMPGRLDVMGNWQGSALYLLLAAKASGSSRAWFAPREQEPREPLKSAHEVHVELEYANGEKRICFPYSIRHRDHAIHGAVGVYFVALDPNKQLIRFSILDRMNYGQVFLLAATVSQHSLVLSEPCPDSTVLQETPTGTIQRAARYKRSGNRLSVENARLRLKADATSGLILESLVLLPDQRELLTRPVPLLLIQNDRGENIPLELQQVEEGQSERRYPLLRFFWSAQEAGSDALGVSLKMELEPEGIIRLASMVTNRSGKSRRVSLVCPSLEAVLVASRPEEACYLLGTRSMALSAKPLELEENYCGYYPLQFMDIFDARGGGIALIVEDANLHGKKFRFKKDPQGMALAICYPRETLDAGENRSLPPVSLYPHPGDWHEPFDYYRRWIRSAVRAEKVPWKMKDLFFCRRDYPVGGTGYLYHVGEKRYTPDRLIEESLSTFGALDMIDISGWALNERTGRVGDYLENDLGGLEELKRCVEMTHRQGKRLGLYFEGYLIDGRSPMAAQAFPDWQLIQEDGTPRIWVGGKEFFICSGVRDWQEAFSDRVVEVAKRTGADAVYVDQFGYSEKGHWCWAEGHGHPVPSNPPLDEAQMLDVLRGKLQAQGLNVAVYCEQMPCDAMAPRVDGVFDYDIPDGHYELHPTRSLLTRFVFPEMALFKMVSPGIRPVPVTVDELHRALFQGLGVWLKGRGESWYSPDFQSLAHQVADIYQAHGEVLRSPDCVPLIPTLREGLYANLFKTPEKIILTLYNTCAVDMAGELVAFNLPEGWQGEELLSHQSANLSRMGNSTILHGAIAPHCTAVFCFRE